MRYTKLVLIAIIALFTTSVFAGNCGTDQFLTCNPANVGQLRDTTRVSNTYKWSMRTGNGNYNAVSALTFKNWLATTTQDSGRYTNLTVTNLTYAGFPAANYAVLDSALTGYATNPTDTLRLLCGPVVSGYFVAGITGTSNGAALTIGHLPAACRPSHTVVVGLSQVTNNGVTRWGSASIATTGIMTISKTDTAGVQSATFTASGTKGVGAGVTFTFPRF